MNLTKGKINKLYDKKNQSVKKKDNRKMYKRGKDKTFRKKKRGMDLSNRTLKRYKGGENTPDPVQGQGTDAGPGNPLPDPAQDPTADPAPLPDSTAPLPDPAAPLPDSTAPLPESTGDSAADPSANPSDPAYPTDPADPTAPVPDSRAPVPDPTADSTAPALDPTAPALDPTADPTDPTNQTVPVTDGNQNNQFQSQNSVTPSDAQVGQALKLILSLVGSNQSNANLNCAEPQQDGNQAVTNAATTLSQSNSLFGNSTQSTQSSQPQSTQSSQPQSTQSTQSSQPSVNVNDSGTDNSGQAPSSPLFRNRTNGSGTIVLEIHNSDGTTSYIRTTKAITSGGTALIANDKADAISKFESNKNRLKYGDWTITPESDGNENPRFGLVPDTTLSWNKKSNNYWIITISNPSAAPVADGTLPNAGPALGPDGNPLPSTAPDGTLPDAGPDGTLPSTGPNETLPESLNETLPESPANGNPPAPADQPPAIQTGGKRSRRKRPNKGSRKL